MQAPFVLTDAGSGALEGDGCDRFVPTHYAGRTIVPGHRSSASSRTAPIGAWILRMFAVTVPDIFRSSTWPGQLAAQSQTDRIIASAHLRTRRPVLARKELPGRPRRLRGAAR